MCVDLPFFSTRAASHSQHKYTFDCTHKCFSTASLSATEALLTSLLSIVPLFFPAPPSPPAFNYVMGSTCLCGFCSLSTGWMELTDYHYVFYLFSVCNLCLTLAHTHIVCQCVCVWVTAALSTVGTSDSCVFMEGLLL